MSENSVSKLEILGLREYPLRRKPFQISRILWDDIPLEPGPNDPAFERLCVRRISPSRKWLVRFEKRSPEYLWQPLLLRIEDGEEFPITPAKGFSCTEIIHVSDEGTVYGQCCNCESTTGRSSSKPFIYSVETMQVQDLPHPPNAASMTRHQEAFFHRAHFVRSEDEVIGAGRATNFVRPSPVWRKTRSPIVDTTENLPLIWRQSNGRWKAEYFDQLAGCVLCPLQNRQLLYATENVSNEFEQPKDTQLRFGIASEKTIKELIRLTPLVGHQLSLYGSFAGNCFWGSYSRNFAEMRLIQNICFIYLPDESYNPLLLRHDRLEFEIEAFSPKGTWAVGMTEPRDEKLDDDANHLCKKGLPSDEAAFALERTAEGYQVFAVEIPGWQIEEIHAPTDSGEIICEALCLDIDDPHIGLRAILAAKPE